MELDGGAVGVEVTAFAILVVEFAADLVGIAVDDEGRLRRATALVVDVSRFAARAGDANELAARERIADVIRVRVPRARHFRLAVAVLVFGDGATGEVEGE